MKRIVSLLLSLCLLAALTVPAGAASFKDVPSGAWYEKSVSYVSEHKLFKGTGGGMFSPGETMTRGMFVTVLGRVAKADVKAAPGQGLTDVPADAWYAPSVNWACANGYAEAMAGNTFAPGEPVTREEIAVILYNYLVKSGRRLPDDPKAPASFSDLDQVSAQARAAVDFMRAKGLLKGSGKRFNPAGRLTRAEAAQVFMRLDQKLAELKASAPDWSVAARMGYETTGPSITFTTSTQDLPYDGDAWAHIGVTDPLLGVIEESPALDGVFYELASSDESVVAVCEWGGIRPVIRLEPGAEPVHATVTVTRRSDGSTRQVDVTVEAAPEKAPPEPGQTTSPEPATSPEPEVWYTVDDDYVAAYAAEVLRLVNELRAKVGVQLLEYAYEYQEEIQTRTAHLEESFAHDWPISNMGENCGIRNPILSPSGSIDMSPEKAAEKFVSGWANSKGHYANMIYPFVSRFTVGLYLGDDGRLYSAQWFSF